MKYDDRRVEVQLRTEFQHDWAVAVERQGGKLGEDLKSGFGPLPVLDFFRLASEAMAYEDRGETVPDSLREAHRKARELAAPFFVRAEGAMSLNHYLLIFDHETETLEHKEFKDAVTALNAYAQAEREHADAKNLEVVLIGSDSLETVKRRTGTTLSRSRRSPAISWGCSPEASSYPRSAPLKLSQPRFSSKTGCCE